jgi:hypothetical protein
MTSWIRSTSKWQVLAAGARTGGGLDAVCAAIARARKKSIPPLVFYSSCACSLSWTSACRWTRGRPVGPGHWAPLETRAINRSQFLGAAECLDLYLPPAVAGLSVVPSQELNLENVYRCLLFSTLLPFLAGTRSRSWPHSLRRASKPQGPQQATTLLLTHLYIERYIYCYD